MGKLDMVRHSTRSFALLLADGQEIRGVLEARDPELLQKHFGKEITIFGKAIYRPSGSLLRLDAEEIVDTTEGRTGVLLDPGSVEQAVSDGKKVADRQDWGGRILWHVAWRGDGRRTFVGASRAEALKQSYVLDTGVLLNLVRGKELGSRIDREFGLSRAMRLHTISIVTTEN